MLSFMGSMVVMLALFGGCWLLVRSVSSFRVEALGITGAVGCQQTGTIASLHKLVRFIAIYGARQALFKTAGRLRSGRVWWLGVFPWSSQRDIGVIGCGQFAFATIGYIITTRLGNRFAVSFDPDAHASETFSRFYGCRIARTAGEVIAAPDVKLVYVASTHSTHADYAIAALAAGKDVYVEKPIAVGTAQLDQLLQARTDATSRLFAGYNRPFAAAIRELRGHCAGVLGPLSLSCTVQGHVLGPEHWYRRPEEGTRICGNVSHWLDLMVHVMSWRGLPNRWRIACEWSNPEVRDDNLAVLLTSSEGDLVTITMTSRSDPFEGIAETIMLQWGEVSATIDDFRRMKVHVGPRLIQRRYWPKDVGHIAAILQPFESEPRDFGEIEHSTRLMLAVADMVRKGEHQREFAFVADANATIGRSKPQIEGSAPHENV